MSNLKELKNRKKPQRSKSKSNARYYLIGGIAVAAIIVYILATTVLHGQGGVAKPIILYVNQGNGVVNGSNFGELLDTATSHGFNTIFFQIYRSGTLLFSNSSLSQFVVSAHAQDLKIFFALYFTNSTQTIPHSIYTDGEDGISLDMSTLSVSSQVTLLNDLTVSYSGKTAVTTTDPTIPLSPDLLIVETYSQADKQYIHQGIIAGVEVVATTSKQDYEQQVQYALANSNGVMVFDYAGLVKSGY